MSAAADGDVVRVTWVIAPGYYLYRDRIHISSPSGGLGKLQLPPGESKNDAYLGHQIVYHERLEALVPVIRTHREPLVLKLTVGYQGCAEAGLCYPPTTRELSVRLPAG